MCFGRGRTTVRNTTTDGERKRIRERETTRRREKEGEKESVVSGNISTMPRVQRLISKRYIFPDKIAERGTKKGNALRHDQREATHVRQAQLLFIQFPLFFSLALSFCLLFSFVPAVSFFFNSPKNCVRTRSEIKWRLESVIFVSFWQKQPPRRIDHDDDGSKKNAAACN